MLIVRLFCSLLLAYILCFYIHVYFYCILISGGNELPTTWLPFYKVHSCYRWRPNFHYIHSATEILNARKGDIYWNPQVQNSSWFSVKSTALCSPPLLDWNEMCLKLKWNTSHAATVGPRFASIPGVKSIHYLSSWPVSWPPLQLSCWTAIALNSLGLPQLTNDSQLLSKTGADNKGLILNNAVVVVF